MTRLLAPRGRGLGDDVECARVRAIVACIAGMGAVMALVILARMLLRI